LEDETDSDRGEEWIMWVKTAEPSVEPPNSVAIEMAITKLINRKSNWTRSNPGQID